MNKTKAELISEIRELFIRHLTLSLAKRREKASEQDRYQALALAVRDLLTEKWLATRDQYDKVCPRTVCYLSLEFLMGRTLGNAMINLGILDEAEEAVRELGCDLGKIRDEEVDAGLGNGGLGRLAACFLDSLATLEFPAFGYGIRYDYGIFKQEIENNCQVEEPDNWLRAGNPWEIRRPEMAVMVFFGGRTVPYNDEKQLNCDRKRVVGAQAVTAMPYDTPIPGYSNNTVNTLRLWSAEAVEKFNLSKFNDGDYISANLGAALAGNITRVLYPSDNNSHGKELRLKQEFFLVSATLQNIVQRVTCEWHKPIADLPRYAVVQLNDTHPALAIPELMRILVDDRGMEWEEAFGIVRQTFNYTNHTLMSEALETWPVSIMEKLLPRQLEIIYEINYRFLRDVSNHCLGDNAVLEHMSIIGERPYKMVRMANLCVAVSGKVNGVASLHTELLKNGLFQDFNRFYPDKFVNVTNGITPRRWLLKSNRGLSAVISSRIGNTWPNHLSELKKLESFANDASLLEEMRQVKFRNKELLSRVIRTECGILTDPSSLFDVQVKRLHEYKRQFLNILHAITLYLEIKENPRKDFVPRTIIFGAKAAPAYCMAKLIIRLINAAGNVINEDPDTAGKLKIVFLPNYRVSLAEKIIPAADLSEQISLAGTEASGTSNMKFALNGALTIGTMDGANVEICQQVGRENIFIFGMNVDEVKHLRESTYRPWDFIRQNPLLERAVELIRNGFFLPSEKEAFRPLIDSLGSDYFMVAADFASYAQVKQEIAELYPDQPVWQKKCVFNIANMGVFSSDRSIEEYASRIWHVSPEHVSAVKKKMF